MDLALCGPKGTRWSECWTKRASGGIRALKIRDQQLARRAFNRGVAMIVAIPCVVSLSVFGLPWRSLLVISVLYTLAYAYAYTSLSD